METAVYLFTGFLEAGKTKFIKETLEDPNFNNPERRYLVILCEEGEEELLAEDLSDNVSLVVFDSEDKLTPDRLEAQKKRAKADVVVVEYNGMWTIDKFYNALPDGWMVYQEVLIIDSTTAKLREMGVTVETVEIDGETAMKVSSDGNLRATHVKTFFYPGFPTDMQPQFAPLMCVAEGISTISEGVWANRFRYVDELCKMGARVSVDGSTATFVGGAKLQGAPVVAFDLRAGAAMIIAGMIASGQTEISNVQVIDRGFYNIVNKLKKLGADIKRISE